jgi:hypothetical protein
VEFRDHPKPSWAYVGFIVLLVVPTTLPSVLMFLGYGALIAIATCIMTFPGLLLLLLLLHAGYATEYRVDGDAVNLRCGLVMNRRIPLKDIQSVEAVHAIPRVLGWNPGALGYCNRFRDGLKLTTATHAIYLSPSDSDAFQKALEPGAHRSFAKGDPGQFTLA